ncbi:MAG: hypothetical protein WKF75_18840 [Singulisphaera sp.]
MNYLDLARDHLQAALTGAAPGEIPLDVRASMTSELAQLDERMQEVQTRMGDLEIERQVGPLERASFAMSQGAPAFALRELEAAEQFSGANPALIKPQLIDLYCDTGQPEKALDLLGGSADADDPTLGTEPGGAALVRGGCTCCWATTNMRRRSGSSGRSPGSSTNWPAWPPPRRSRS